MPDPNLSQTLSMGALTTLANLVSFARAQAGAYPCLEGVAAHVARIASVPLRNAATLHPYTLSMCVPHKS